MKRLFIFLFATISAIHSFAQAYKFTTEEQSIYFVCETGLETLTPKLDNPPKRVALSLMSDKTEKEVIIGFYNAATLVYCARRDKSTIFNAEYYLSNGKILTLKSLPAKGGIAMKSLLSSDDLTQLRKYNITKIKFLGHESVLTNFRSAATIDAMCKALISKTGDKGQYGKAPSGGSTSSSTTNRPSTTNKPSTTASTSTKKPTTTSSVSSNSKPATTSSATTSSSSVSSTVSSKSMTLRQMITKPLGVLPENSKGMDKKEVERMLKAASSKWEVLFNSGGELHPNNYDMAYLGNIPGAKCDFKYYNNKVGLSDYEYVFYFKKSIDATLFYNNLLLQRIKAEGGTIQSQQGTKDNERSFKATCYGRTLNVRQRKCSSCNKKYQVVLNVAYQ